MNLALYLVSAWPAQISGSGSTHKNTLFHTTSFPFLVIAPNTCGWGSSNIAGWRPGLPSGAGAGTTYRLPSYCQYGLWERNTHIKLWRWKIRRPKSRVWLPRIYVLPPLHSLGENDVKILLHRPACRNNCVPSVPDLGRHALLYTHGLLMGMQCVRTGALDSINLNSIPKIWFMATFWLLATWQ